MTELEGFKKWNKKTNIFFKVLQFANLCQLRMLLESLWRLPFALILKLHLLCKCQEILMQLGNSALILNNFCKTRLSLAVGKWTIMKWIGENWTGLRTICQGPRTGNNLQKDLWRRKIILRYQMSFCCCWSWLHTILPSSEGSMQMNGD